MSNAYLKVTSGNLPPEVATSYETQNGTAVPSANILIVNGVDSTENNANGIIAKGGVAGTGTVNDVDIVLTNRITGTVETVGATSQNVITFTPPATAGIYDLIIHLCAFNAADVLGTTYEINGAVVCDGLGFVATTGTPTIEMDGNAAFNVNQVNVSISLGVIDVTVLGLATKTIRWTGLMTYTFGGA